MNQQTEGAVNKLAKREIIVKYLRGGLALERFLPLGVAGSDILFLRFKHDQQTHVSKSAGNRSGD